jgi:hypothetical protein
MLVRLAREYCGVDVELGEVETALVLARISMLLMGHYCGRSERRLGSSGETSWRMSARGQITARRMEVAYVRTSAHRWKVQTT